MNPERIRELADDLERYQVLYDRDDPERASWERAIAAELVGEIGPQLGGWSLVRTKQLEHELRFVVWGRVLRLLLFPLALGLGLAALLVAAVDLNVVATIILSVAGFVLAVWMLNAAHRDMEHHRAIIEELRDE